MTKDELLGLLRDEDVQGELIKILAGAMLAADRALVLSEEEEQAGQPPRTLSDPPKTL